MSLEAYCNSPIPSGGGGEETNSLIMGRKIIINRWFISQSEIFTNFAVFVAIRENIVHKNRSQVFSLH